MWKVHDIIHPYMKSKQPSLKGLTSGWASMSKDSKNVIAHAKTLTELVKKLEKKGNPEGVITRVANRFTSYVG